MNRKVKSFKQSVSVGTMCSVKSYKYSNAVFQHWHRPIIVLPFVYCPVDNTLFDVSPEIRCSDMSSRYCCYGKQESKRSYETKVWETSLQYSSNYRSRKKIFQFTATSSGNRHWV